MPTANGSEDAALQHYWALDASVVLGLLKTRADGLSASEADARLATIGPNALDERRPSWLATLASQLGSPLLLLLVFAALASALTGEWTDAAIVLAIVSLSVGLGLSREYDAQTAAQALKARVQTRVNVLRDGRLHRLPVEQLVPGDVVSLAAGSLVPADCLLLAATDFHVSESMLTGESYPTLKGVGKCEPATPLAQRKNCVFLGSNVRSGTARALVVHTGKATSLGAVAERLSQRPPETEFDRGMTRFGYLLTSVMVVLAASVFVVHVARGRPPIETLLFSIALAVGLSPELLPAILSVNLASGATRMAKRGVLVRRLKAIENLGSMDVLCTDKTGTLTEGVVRLEGAYDADGQPSPAVLRLGARNAALDTGLANPLDQAVLDAAGPLPTEEKLAEVPFDFTRKRVSVVVRDGRGARLIAKGAFHHVLDACTRMPDGQPLSADARSRLEQRYDAWGAQGIRVMAVAERELAARPGYTQADEQQLVFRGFLTFLDRPKPGVGEALRALAELGITVKLITGDSRLVAEHVASLVGLRAGKTLTGVELDALSSDALAQLAERTDLFVEVDPNQKERIILALKRRGHVVGFLGDGVNDAPAMHAADTSLSVDDAVDVARDAADFVLLERHLDVIRQGVVEGRKTFANTLKYVLMTMSANLGNMISMAVASLWLPFLPLLAGQVLLNNFLSDIPAFGLSSDGVDPELVRRPRRWDLGFVGRFMLEFGLLSSAFDFLTFAALLALHARPELFRSGWFVESLLTEILVALLIRTRRPFYRSRPGTFVLISTGAVALVGLATPYLPLANRLGFAPLPAKTLACIATITLAYMVAVELNKARFYRRSERAQNTPPTFNEAPASGSG